MGTSQGNGVAITMDLELMCARMMCTDTEDNQATTAGRIYSSYRPRTSRRTGSAKVLSTVAPHGSARPESIRASRRATSGVFQSKLEPKSASSKTVSSSVTSSYGQSMCESVTTKSTCKWQDTACHAIWSSQTVKVDYGYIRRRWDFHDGKGDQTAWIKDWDASEKADELHHGCRADCAARLCPA